MYPKTVALFTFTLLVSFPLTATATPSLLGNHALSARRLLFGDRAPRINYIPNGGTYYNLGNAPQKRDEESEPDPSEDNGDKGISETFDDGDVDSHSLEARARMPKNKPGLLHDPSGKWGIGNGRPKQKRDTELDHEASEIDEDNSHSLEARELYFMAHPKLHPYVPKDKVEYLHTHKPRFIGFRPMRPSNLGEPVKSDRNRFAHKDPHKKPFVHNIKEKRDEGLEYPSNENDQYSDQDVSQTLETHDTVHRGRPVITYDQDGHRVAYAWPKSNYKRDGLVFDPSGDDQFLENGDDYEDEDPVSGDADADADGVSDITLQLEIAAKPKLMAKRGVEYDGTFGDDAERGKGYVDVRG